MANQLPSCSADQSGSEACNYKEDSDFYPASDSVQYYGRGPFYLSWNYNYGALSASAFGGLDGNQVLLDDPDKIIEDEDMAYYSAFWFYMWPQSPKPSMHDALLGFFEPS
jgi:chitinase